MLKLRKADYPGIYHGFTLKEGYYYGINTSTGTPIATSGWECAGNLCLYFLNDGKWEKEWVGIEENNFDVEASEFNPSGKMSFLEWLGQEYSITPEERDGDIYLYEDEYDSYFYDGLPEFVRKYL